MLRLDKFLSDMEVAGRAQAKKLIRQGAVEVNGEVCRLPERKIQEGTDCVRVQGQEIAYQKFSYYLLHKPAGYVSSTKETDGPSVLRLMEGAYGRGLFPVGRLDKDTEGLLLMTNDGELGHRLTSPRHHVDKTYWAVVTGRALEEDIHLFEEGVDIQEKRPAMPAALHFLEERPGDGREAVCLAEVTVREGRYHQVKRMFAAVGRQVLYLKRVAMGPLSLDPSLGRGAYRPLTEEEVQQLKGAGRDGGKLFTD